MPAGFNSAINASLSSMNETSAATATISGNVANASTNAYKKIEKQYAAVVGSEIGTVSGVSSHTRQIVDVAGEMKRTGIGTDLAIEGRGFAVVTDGFTGTTPNNFYMTRDLSFRKDKSNLLVNSSGYYLLAWPVGVNDTLPTTKALLTSLSGVNVTQWTSQAAATSEIDFACNLLSTQKVVGQSTANIAVVSTQTTPSPINVFAQKDDLLFPNPTNSLTEGEGLEVTIGQATSSTGTTTQKIIYGGFAKTFEFSNGGTDLVANGTTQLVGDTISVKTSTTNSIVVTRGAGSTNQAVLQNIADQINANSPQVNGIIAQVFSINGKTSLMIAPMNINQNLDLAGTTAFRNAIGLDDTKAVKAFVPDAAGITIGRFATMQQLSDVLDKMNIPTEVISNPKTGAQINILSDQPIAFNNYQPLGAGSDFVAEFGLPSGYLKSEYDPYIPARNMASGAFNNHFSQNVTIYDSMGNEHNLLISFLKTGVNEWGVEVHAVDPLSVNISGRTDGLLMAGTMQFDGSGSFVGIQPASQYSYTKDIAAPNQALGATVGMDLALQVGTTSYSFVYGSISATSSAFSGSGTGLVSPANSTDQFNIDVGAISYSVTRGAGGTNLEVLNNIANQINSLGSGTVLRAVVEYDIATAKYSLKVQSVDTTQSVSFSGTNGMDIALGITSAKNIAANSFETLDELALQINQTQGLNAARAQIIRNPDTNAYAMRVSPLNQGFFLTFGGGTGVVGIPLGTGNTTTIATALGLENTSAATQLTSLDEQLVINWASNIGSDPNTISFNWGIFGSSESMTQVSGSYSVRRSSQNGVSVGDLTGVTIDPEGWIIATFSNSLTRSIYKIPIADFANPNGLTPMPGNVYQISSDSGPLNLKEASQNGAGKFVSGTLEGSNIDIASELADLILVQRQYQASSRVVKVVDDLAKYLMDRTFT